MFKFLQRFRKNKPQPETVATASTTAVSDGSRKKKCPKCHRQFSVQAVICELDSTLLMLTQPGDIDQFENTVMTATRADGTVIGLRCQDKLGTGSICDAYTAYDDSTDARYIVKSLKSELHYDSKTERRFLEGAKIGLSLEHENIVGTVALGKSLEQNHACGRPFMVCQYLDSKPLSLLIDKEELPSVSDTLAIARDVCAALEYAHALGIRHGDLKPSNIYFETTGSDADAKVVAKVCDFGCAERLFRGLEWDKVSTMTCSVYGSVTYLAPDFVHSRHTTEVADFYSLGCVMYECLTGRPPFIGENDFLTIMMHCDQPPMPFSADYTPKPVADIVMKALEKDPRNRWQSAAEMRAAIEKL